MDNEAKVQEVRRGMTVLFTEKDLAGLAAELGLSYEINYDQVSVHLENKSRTVKVWVKMKGLRSKRYAVFAYGEGQQHTKRHCFEIALQYGKLFDGDSLSPEAVRLVRDHAADFMVRRILTGCSVKISNTRHVVMPPSGSVEEMKLKLAVSGCC